MDIIFRSFLALMLLFVGLAALIGGIKKSPNPFFWTQPGRASYLKTPMHYVLFGIACPGGALLGVQVDGDLLCVLAEREVLMNGVFDFGRGSLSDRREIFYVFVLSTFVLTQKWSKKSRTALMPPAACPASATAALQ